MRNQFRRPKKVNCANSIFLKQTILAGNIYERSEYILPATLYKLAEHHQYSTTDVISATVDM